MSRLSVYKELVNLHKEAFIGRRRILESACGPGILAIGLLEQESEVHALDNNPEALDMLKKKSGHNDRLYTYCQDAHKLQFEGCLFDGVSSMLALPFMENPVGYLKEHKRVMKVGGIFVVSGPSETARDTNWMMRQWKRDLTQQGISEELQCDWDIFERYTKESANVNVINWFSIQKLSKILEDNIGLHVTKEIQNPLYYGKGYVILAEKMK